MPASLGSVELLSPPIGWGDFMAGGVGIEVKTKEIGGKTVQVMWVTKIPHGMVARMVTLCDVELPAY